LWTPKAQSTFDELRNSILGDPCLQRFHPHKLTVLQTDFSSKGFGYVVCQADNDDTSLALASQVMSGNGFHFLTKTNGFPFTPSHLVHVGVVATNNSSTPTLVKASLGIGQ
jgi:hypothetical protein